MDLSNARILIANDDGINSDGIRVLEEIACSISNDVWVIAPESEQSAAGHSLTIHRPLRIRKLNEQRYAVDGTPTDCVLVGAQHIMKDKRPDLVLSGINHGKNIAEDITYSGTIAAAMEATLLGIPAIAFSQQRDADQPPEWHNARKFGAALIKKLVASMTPWPAGRLLNVNFPYVPSKEVTGLSVQRHGSRKVGDDIDERFDPRGRSYIWIGAAHQDDDIAPDTDLAALNQKKITVTPLQLDLTAYDVLDKLSADLDGTIQV